MKKDKTEKNANIGKKLPKIAFNVVKPRSKGYRLSYAYEPLDLFINPKSTEAKSKPSTEFTVKTYKSFCEREELLENEKLLKRRENISKKIQDHNNSTKMPDS